MKKKNYRRRVFLKTLGICGTATLSGLPSWAARGSATPSVDKREAIFRLIEGDPLPNYTPAGFFVHFGKNYRWGDAAVDRHLEYFRAIDMDFIKIQYEQVFPPLEQIRKPSDWGKMPFYGKAFYEQQLYVVKELVRKGKSLAPVIVTLYSPFMCAGHSVTSDLLTQHMKEDPEQVKKGLEIITESVLTFARECIDLGVDGFLASTQGGEAFRFSGTDIFENFVKPSDLIIMEEINSSCDCNVLHICDYEGSYDDLQPFLDYPGQIVNCSMEIGDQHWSTSKLHNFFDRPFMGGMLKSGLIATGTREEIRAEVQSVLEEAPQQFILAAECALLGDIHWPAVRVAVDAAHHIPD